MDSGVAKRERAQPLPNLTFLLKTDVGNSEKIIKIIATRSDPIIYGYTASNSILAETSSQTLLGELTALPGPSVSWNVSVLFLTKGKGGKTLQFTFLVTLLYIDIVVLTASRIL